MEGGTDTHRHAGLEQDSEPPVRSDSELRLQIVKPEPGGQLEGPVRVPAAAAAADAPRGLVVVVSVALLIHPSHPIARRARAAAAAASCPSARKTHRTHLISFLFIFFHYLQT